MIDVIIIIAIPIIVTLAIGLAIWIDDILDNMYE